VGQIDGTGGEDAIFFSPKHLRIQKEEYTFEKEYDV
jgi:hypothetical protein